MLYYSGPVARLVDEFAKLPGIGAKTAQRLAFYVLNAPPEMAQGLAKALVEVRQSVKRCSRCCNLTDEDPVMSARIPHAMVNYCAWWRSQGMLLPWKRQGVTGVYIMCCMGLYHPWKVLGRRTLP
ncbi:hypothetical protein N752_15625 [Desulforamulus aquiferis]|nr:hypothetical protein N752_15625 [Desulforamulus aquiferis]